MKILVVDDEQLLVKGMKFNLENEGYTVETAYDGATAIDMAKSGGAVLDAHAASANHRILHVPCLLSPVVFVVFKRIPTRYRETSLSMPAWLYAILIGCCNAYKALL